MPYHDADHNRSFPEALNTALSTCTIRPAELCDSAAMARLAVQLGYECTAEQVQKRLLQMRDPNQHRVYVAELPDGGIAGWIGVFLFRSVETGSSAEINGLIVEESLRSRGIGRALLAAAEAWAKSIGSKAISVHSNIKRDRAHHFYLNNRYQHVKTQKEFQKILSNEPAGA